MTDYYPFGEIRVDQASTTYKNPYKFTGKEFDVDTGLYYYGARYYNPAIGRFISQDPWEGDLRDPQSLNKYSYVLNNPLKYVDPTGKFAELITDIARAKWKAGIITYLYPNDYGITGELLWHALQNEPEDLAYEDDSYIASEIRKSKEYQTSLKEVKSRISKGELQGTYDKLEFQNGDLHAGLNKVKYKYQAIKTNNGYDVNITITDTYDFALAFNKYADETLITFANNMAWYDVFFGVVNKYGIKVKMKESIKVDKKKKKTNNNKSKQKSSTKKKK